MNEPQGITSICPKCGNHYDKTSSAQDCCWKCVPPDAPTADPISLDKARRLEELEARIKQMESIIGDLPFPEEAKRVAGITCRHLPRLIIGSESGYICCECWAQQAEAVLSQAARAAERCDYATVARLLFPYKSK